MKDSKFHYYFIDLGHKYTSLNFSQMMPNKHMQLSARLWNYVKFQKIMVFIKVDNVTKAPLIMPAGIFKFHNKNLMYIEEKWTNGD